MNSLRSKQRKPVVSLDIHDSGPLGPRPAEQLVKDRGAQPMHHLQQEELAQVIQQALSCLNERQRVAVVLNKFEDMGYAEIAEVMGLTVKGVKSLLSRARVNLRITLQDYVCMEGEAVAEELDEE
jgi:RNA polymerase sigma-70 factor (ECF subfamily)